MGKNLKEKTGLEKLLLIKRGNVSVQHQHIEKKSVGLHLDFLEHFL